MSSYNLYHSRNQTPLSIYVVVFAFCCFFSQILITPAVATDADVSKKVLEKAFSDLLSTGGRDCVHKAVSQLVEIQDVEVVGAGSHISGNYTPGKSDHDFTLRLGQTMDDSAAKSNWKAARSRLEFNVRFEAERRIEENIRRELLQNSVDPTQAELLIKEMRSDIKHKARNVADDFLSRTNLYPPEQLMAGVNNSEEAMLRFKELDVTPSLSHRPGEKLTKEQWEAASEGIWGDGGLPFRQQYEDSAGRIWYKEVVTESEGTIVSRVRTGFTDLTHMADGYGKYSVEGAASTSHQWSSMAQKAFDEGDYRTAFKDMKRTHLDLKKSRDLASLPAPGATPMAEFYDDFQRISKSADTLPPGQRAAAINTAIDELFDSPGYRKRFASALDHSRKEAELLATMGRSQSGMRRAVMREMLEGSTHPAQKLWEAVQEAAQTYPVEHILTGLFIYWDTVESANRAGTGDVDGAARKAFEALAGVLTGVAPGLMMSMTNLLIDAAKDAGYAMAVSSQDCLDLLAGIVSVKGWEGADSLGAGSETDIDQLAFNIAHEKKIKQVVETAIRNASTNGNDSDQVNQGKQEALTKRCESHIINAWRDRRLAMFNDYLDTLASIDAIRPSLGVMVDVNPAPVRLLKRSKGGKSAQVTLTARLIGPVNKLSTLLTQAREQIKRLGGMHNRTLLDPYYLITWTGITPSDSDGGYRSGWPVELDRFSIIVDKPGDIKFGCKVELNLRVQSTITDGVDYDQNSISVIGNLLLGKLPGWVTTHQRGDVLATHRDKTKRTVTFDATGLIEVRDSDLDDSMAVSISGATQVLAGETIGFQATIETAADISSDDFRFQWQGAKAVSEGWALFSRNQAGVYPVQVAVSPVDDSSDQQAVQSRVVEIEVLDPAEASFTITIQGPTTALVDHDIYISADVIGNNLTGERRLDDQNIFLSWSAGGVKIDTGSLLRLEASEPGQYELLAELVDDNNGVLSVLASARHHLTIEGIQPAQGGDDKADVTPEKDLQHGNQAKQPIQSKSTLEKKKKTEKSKDQHVAGAEKTSVVQKEPVISTQKKPKDVAENNGLPPEMAEMVWRAYLQGWRKGQQHRTELDEPPETSRGSGTDEALMASIEWQESELFNSPAFDDMANKRTFESIRTVVMCQEKFAQGYLEGLYNKNRPSRAELEKLTGPLPPLAEEIEKSTVVAVIPSEKQVAIGETVSFQAVVKNISEEDRPLIYTWRGHDQGTGDTVMVKAVEPGSRVVSVQVIGQQGDIGEAQATIDIGAVTVSLDTIPAQPVVGTPVPLSATVSVDGESATGNGYVLRWEPYPEVAFTPHEGAATSSQALFDRPGDYTVWVAVGRNGKSGFQQLAESQQVTVTVTGVEMSLSASPDSIKLGQSVTVTAALQPGIDSKFVRMVWSHKGKVADAAAAKDGLSYTFRPRETTPVTVTADLLTSKGAEKMDSDDIVVSATPYTVTVSPPKRLGSAPRVWSESAKGLVEVPQGIATFQNAEVHAILSPDPPAGVSYKWRVSPAGCNLSAPYSSSTRINASQPGQYQLEMVVTDKDGIELGIGSGSFVVTIDKDLHEKGNQKDGALKEIEKLLSQAKKEYQSGKFEAAIELVQNALSIDPKNSKAKKLLQQWQQAEESKKQQYNELIQKGYAEEKAGQLVQAVEHYRQAQLIRQDDKVSAHIAELEKRLKVEQEDKNRFDKLLEAGYAKEKAGDLTGAIVHYKDAAQIHSDPKILAHIQELEEQLKGIENKSQQAAKLLAAGYKKEKAGDLEGAVNQYTEAVEIQSDAKVLARIQALKKEIEKGKKNVQQRQQEELAGQYREEGDILIQAKKWQAARKKLQQAQKIAPNKATEKQIQQLNKNITKAEAKKSEQQRQQEELADQYRKEGGILIQAKKWQAASKKLQQAQKIAPNKETEKQIQQLSKTIAKVNSEAKKQKQRERQAQATQTARRDEQKSQQMAPTPWTGNYRFYLDDGHTTTDVILRLIQKGNRLSGTNTTKISTQGKVWSNETGSIHGSCSGRTGQISAEGGSMNVQLSAEGNSIITKEGASFKRIE